MGRSKTQELTESIHGEHLALSVAAHLARSRLVADPLARYDGQHLLEMVEIVAAALIKVTPVYVRDVALAPPRELRPAELEGAVVGNGAHLMTLSDGRRFTTMTIKRGDLRRAIALLGSVGVPGLSQTAAPAPLPQSKPENDPLRTLAEIEELVGRPLERDRASKLLLSIARSTKDGRSANLAMQLMSALQASLDDVAAVKLAELRAALEETTRTS